MRLRRVLLLLVAPAAVGLAGCTGDDRPVADAGTSPTPAATGSSPAPTTTRSTAPGDFYPAPFVPVPGRPDLPSTPPSLASVPPSG